MTLEPEDVLDVDDGQRYADQVNAPLTRETLEALRAALASEEHARFRRIRRNGGTSSKAGA